MAAAMTMDREPEVARFIDSYKYDQDMATRRDRYGGGTSLPLNSDGYEEKQQRLRDERHKDWLVQQDKPRDPPVYYRVGTPEQGFPGLGEYDKHRKDFNLQRQKEYNDMLKKQRQMEQQKYEARRRSPPRPAQPPGPQMDYNLAGEQARAEERRAYQDYMGKYQSSYIPTKVPLDYEENKKILNEERRREYNEMMEQKAKEERYWAMRGRPVTPPGGLDIGKYDRQLKETAQQKKKEYKEMLDQQQREHMYLRARQEPEMAVIDRNAAQPSQYLANKPPPGPSYGKGRDEAFKTDTYSRQPPPAPEQAYSRQPPNVLEQSYPKQQPSKSEQPYTGPSFSRDGPRPVEKYEKYTNDVEGLFGRPEQSPDRPRSRRSYDAERRPSPSKKDGVVLPNNQLSPRRMKNVLYTDSEEVSSKRREASKERQKEYNEFLKLKAEERRRHDEMRQQQQISKPAELVKNPYYSSDDYEKFQREIQRKQGEEYRDFLAKKSTEVHNRGWNFEQNGVLELRGDDEVQTRQRELRAERQKDYNSYISQMKTPSKRTWPDPEGRGALLVKQGEYDNVRQMYDEERKRDYIDRMQKRREQKYTNPSRRHDFVDTASGPYGGLFHGLGEHGNKSDVLNKERQQEYNDRLDHQFGKDRPSGRPNWVKETLPNNTDRGRSPMKSQPPADQYQQMLDEKRREEASRRRFEDPEYQDRLAQGRDRGEAGGRYGY